MHLSQPFRWVTAPLLSVLIAAASAGPVSAQDVSVREFRQRVDNYFARYADKSADELLRDSTATAEMTELRFQVQVLLNQGESLKDFADVGLVAAASGRRVSMDLKGFPQWWLLQDRLRRLADPDGFAISARNLRALGFRDQDFAALTAYLSTHDLDRMNYEAGKSRRDAHINEIRSGKDISVTEFYAFMHELRRLGSEITRRWSVALLDSLQPHGQYVLISLFEDGAGAMSIGADDDTQEQLRKYLTMVRGDAAFEAHLRQEAERFAKPRERAFSLDPKAPLEESKDPQWSQRMEQRLEQYFAGQHLAARFQITDIDCRTTYCDLKAEGALEGGARDAFATAVEELCRGDWGLMRGGGGSGPKSKTRMEMRERLRRKM